MPDVVRELAMTVAAVKKLGARGISEREVEQLTGNRYVIVANRGRRRDARKARDRRLLVGRTNGGRGLTPVVQRTPELTSWIVVTGWNSTKAERKILTRKAES
jgi:hypothetical protein